MFKAGAVLNPILYFYMYCHIMFIYLLRVQYCCLYHTQQSEFLRFLIKSIAKKYNCFNFKHNISCDYFWLFTFRLKNFCGVIAESVVSKTNKLHIRFFAEKQAVKSKFVILYTSFRPKALKGDGKLKYLLLFIFHKILNLSKYSI